MLRYHKIFFAQLDHRSSRRINFQCDLTNSIGQKITSKDPFVKTLIVFVGIVKKSAGKFPTCHYVITQTGNAGILPCHTGFQIPIVAITYAHFQWLLMGGDLACLKTCT